MINTIKKFARGVRRTVWGDVSNVPVFFLHVPKCGGTSIIMALLEAYGLRSGMRFDLRGKIHHSAFFSLDSHASREAAERLGVPMHELREHVLLYQMSRYQMSHSNRKFISGHFFFSDVAYERYHDTYTFITLIREPVERWYSQYFYNRDKPGDHFAVDDPLDEYLHSPVGRSSGSLIARFFAGSDCSEDKIVERAIENITKFNVVGVLEDLGTFRGDLRHVLGTDINIPVVNTSPTPADQKRKEITPEINRKVVDVCRPDKEVYDYVVENLIGNSQSRVSDEK